MYKKIDTESLKQKFDNGEDFYLIEVLASKEFKKRHIQGAENIPFGKIGSEAKARFKKDDEIVVYCFDKACRASIIAAEKLDQFGFSNVYDYEAGKDGWEEAGYPLEGTQT